MTKRIRLKFFHVPGTKQHVGLAPTRNPGQGAIDLGLSASTPEIKSNVSGNHHLEPENDANTEGGDS